MPDIGPKRARALHERLGVDGLGALRRATDEGRLHGLPGFGPDLIARIAGLHSYEVPAITVWPIDKLLASYAEWVEECTW